ncbi:MAG: sodium ion-translocating decarboxylase subunit beta [Clostridiales bacterium]|nr:sodium ion-translocating decarboxylase subunit beta [Clostridiales bacterium]MDY5677804.1 sodium ion-translocating decarboxylase subunit beta [Eubacteriales bacterium]
MDILGSLVGLWEESGFYNLFINFTTSGWQNIVMIIVACLLLFLGIAKRFEPLLLVGIAFGMLLTNLPNSGVYTPELWISEAATANGVDYGEVLRHGGLIDILYIGVKTGVYPSLIFIGVGAMTDFGPMLARPSSLLLGAAAQLGIYIAFIGAITLCGFDAKVAASIGIIGGADGPTAIWLTKTLAPEYLGSIAIAAYSYMALIPLIQPPIIRLLTTKKERLVRMDNPKQVSKATKIIFPIVVTIFVVLLLPSVAGLLGCLMFGNLLKECGVTDRLSDTAQNALMNIVTLFLGISVGATATAANFLKLETLMIVALGLVAFCCSTAGGVLFGKLMCKISKGKINPMIGAAGVSAVPMAARVVHNEGRRYDLDNHLLMHAMAPNVAGVIGSAVAAGLFMSLFG